MAAKAGLEDALRKTAKQKKSPAGESYYSLELNASREIARKYDESLKNVEVAALKHHIVPERYQRNVGTVGLEGQIKLLSSTAAVIGLGGLGGLVAELLARMGTGTLILVDGDTFSENNLNRQLMVSELNLGKGKAEEAAHRINTINSAVEVKLYSFFVDEKNLREILNGSQVVLDCLDNLGTRFALEKVCQELRIPMVHGAIAGNMGQLAVIRPGIPLLSEIYGRREDNSDAENTGHGVEVMVGNPAATPALVGSWEVNEAVKILLQREGILHNELLLIDLQNNEIRCIPLRPDKD